MDYTLSSRQVSRQFNVFQVESARRIRKGYLKTLGLSHSPSQAALHAGLRDPIPIFRLSDLDGIDEWLQYLKGQFPAQAAPVFDRNWYLCAVRAAGLGPDAYKRWRRSPLSRGVLSLRRRAILTALCGVRLRYRSAPYRWLEPLSDG